MRLRLLLVAVVVAGLAGAAVGAAVTPGAVPSAGVPSTGGAPRLPTSARGPVKRPPTAPLIVTSAYGRRGLGWHSGVDLRAREGAPLAAVGPGVVERARLQRRGGLSVIVKLDDGWRAGYAHLSRIDVAEGQRVDQGTTVGLAGATGHATGPHLHFELRDPRSRALVDPWPLLAGHSAAASRGARKPAFVDALRSGAWRQWRLVRRSIARAV